MCGPAPLEHASPSRVLQGQLCLSSASASSELRVGPQDLARDRNVLSDQTFRVDQRAVRPLQRCRRNEPGPWRGLRKLSFEHHGLVSEIVSRILRLQVTSRQSSRSRANALCPFPDKVGLCSVLKTCLA